MRRGPWAGWGITVAILVAACGAPAPSDPTPTAEGVRASIDDGRFADAERIGRAWLTDVEAQDGVDSLAAAEALDLLVESLWKGGKSGEPSTRSLAQRAVRIKESADPDGLGLAESLTNLAIVVEGSGKYAEAQGLYERALDIRRARLPWDHLQIADSLYNLGIAVMLNGDYAGARTRFEQALEIHDKVNASPLVHARVLNSLGVLFHQTGDYEQARETHSKALEIRRANLRPDHPAIAGSLHNLALAVRRLGHPVEAVRYNEEALAIRQKALGANHPMVASTLNNLGELLDELGNPERATYLYRQAVDNLEKSVGESHPDLALVLDTLGSRVYRGGDFEGAKAIYSRALTIQERALGTDHPFTGESIEALARAQRALGDRAVAFDNALRSEAISREHLQLTARTMSERQALEYSAQRVHSIGLPLSMCRDDPGACAERVWDVVIGSRALVLDEMAIRHRISDQSSSPRVAALAKELQQARERLARAFIAGSGLNDPKAYRRTLDDARRTKERLERKLAQESKEFRDALKRDRAGLDQVRDRLPAGTALVAFYVYRYTRAGMAEADEVPHYLALVLSADHGIPTVFGLGRADEIDELVRDWQRESARVARPGRERAVEAEYRVAGAALRSRIWDPVAAIVGSAESVFLVPDGALQLVSFATLPVGDDRYLVETGPRLHYLSTERDLLDERREISSRRLLALGDPAFESEGVLEPATTGTASTRRSGAGADGPAPCITLQDMRFKPLSGLRREIDLITELWRQRFDSEVVQLTGEQASETALKRHAPGTRVLHLATHGFFFGASCLSDEGRRGFGLTGPPKEVPDDPDALANPLLLSGLAVAGANRRHEGGSGSNDGIVTAEELTSLNLDGTEWVVLSACDTGVGKVLPGEGVFGLRRAFRIAGARTLIMSLWSVDDNSTKEWMVNLYRARLVEGLSTSQAVRRASLTLLDERRRAGKSTHPFFWGGFVAVGDWS